MRSAKKIMSAQLQRFGIFCRGLAAISKHGPGTIIQSLDLNPFELVWHARKHHLRKYVKPANKENFTRGSLFTGMRL
ncbi:hypothetical protein FKM82_020304 [Ascaphus truei]